MVSLYGEIVIRAGHFSCSALNTEYTGMGDLKLVTAVVWHSHGKFGKLKSRFVRTNYKWRLLKAVLSLTGSLNVLKLNLTLIIGFHKDFYSTFIGDKCDTRITWGDQNSGKVMKSQEFWKLDLWIPDIFSKYTNLISLYLAECYWFLVHLNQFPMFSSTS